MPDRLLQQLSHAGQEFLRGMLHLLFPSTCLVCGEAAHVERPNLCDRCRAVLTADTQQTCPRCAGNIGPHAAVAEGCTHCRDQHFHFQQVFRLGFYDGLLRDQILRMKQASGEMLAEVVGAVWAEHLAKGWQGVHAQVVIPVPLHWWRRVRRGYNQSAALARALAAGLNVPCRPSWLWRVRHTPHQTGLSRTERLTNVKDAFRTSPWAKLKNQSVLLVDDVMTTGTTASEAARALRAAGAAGVVVAVLARSHH